MARPSLADSLMASLSKGAHVDTAEKIKRGLPPISDEPAVTPVTVSVQDVTVKAVDVQEVMIGSSPAVVSAPSPKPKATAKQKAAAKPKVQAKPEAAHINTHSGMDTNKGATIQTGMNTGTLSGMNTGIEAGPDRHGYRSEPIDAGIDTNKRASIDTGTHTGTCSGMGAGIDTGLDTSSYSGIDIDTLDSTYIYDHIHPDTFFPFTPGQGKVLLYLIEAGGKSNRNVMATRTGVPLSSLAKTLRLLIGQMGAALAGSRLFVEAGLAAAVVLWTPPSLYRQWAATPCSEARCISWVRICTSSVLPSGPITAVCRLW